MNKLTFHNVRFVKSAVRAEDFPLVRDDSGLPLPEIAVAGRSNVGKSSLLNQLFRRKDLVKTSATPGKTQLLNFFNADDQLLFVDLPGYGFAQVPLEVRKNWGPMVQGYLENRPALRLMLFLFDIRRLPNEEDFQLLNWAEHAQIPVIMVLTKADKLGHGARSSNARKILKLFEAPNIPHVLFSAHADIGRRELIAMLNRAFLGAEEDHGTD